MKITISNTRQETGAMKTAATYWKEKLLYKFINVGQHGITIPVREFIRKQLLIFFTSIFLTFHFMLPNLNS